MMIILNRGLAPGVVAFDAKPLKLNLTQFSEAYVQACLHGEKKSDSLMSQITVKYILY